MSGPTSSALGRWAIVFLPVVLLFLFPVSGLTPQQNHLLAVFAATIVALVAQPIPMGAVTLIAMTVLALTRTVPATKVFSGFANATVWLIFTAFLFARAVTQTGFGRRVGYFFIRQFARTPLSLGYSLAAADLALAPFIPSDTARGGGIVFPVVRNVASDLGSEPGPTAKKIGEFLTLVSYHTTYAASGIFLTGMAANPLIAEFALKIAHVDLNWTRWLLGSCLPGAITLIVAPLIIYAMARPELTDTAPARKFARTELERMGPLSGKEKRLVAILLAVMAGWITSPWHGVSNTFVALGGVSAILLTHILEWEDLLSEKRAWDALVWFAPLIMMSEQLTNSGVVATLSARWFHVIAGWHWGLAFTALVASYLYIHYGFASMTAHVAALYPAFLTAALAAGAPPAASALAFAYFSNLDAGLTHYGTGSAPVFFGGGYVRQSDWWRIGFVISLFNLAVWLGLGMWWWKLVGLW
jgi:DASS family divalent anion:Na+ symporter